MNKIWDVKRPPRKKPLTNEELIKELWDRRVTIEKIFALYYELDAIGDEQLRRLTVGDALDALR